MTHKNKDKLAIFFDLLFNDNDTDISEIKNDLKASGINLDRIEAKVESLLEVARERKKHNWLIEAQKKRVKISEILNENSQTMRSMYGNAQELLQAIQAGKFGTLLEGKASAFFRNQDFKKMSEADLISFIEDCELLDVLSKDQEENQ